MALAAPGIAGSGLFFDAGLVVESPVGNNDKNSGKEDNDQAVYVNFLSSNASRKAASVGPSSPVHHVGTPRSFHSGSVVSPTRTPMTSKSLERARFDMSPVHQQSVPSFLVGQTAEPTPASGAKVSALQFGSAAVARSESDQQGNVRRTVLASVPRPTHMPKQHNLVDTSFAFLTADGKPVPNGNQFRVAVDQFGGPFEFTVDPIHVQHPNHVHDIPNESSGTPLSHDENASNRPVSGNSRRTALKYKVKKIAPKLCY